MTVFNLSEVQNFCNSFPSPTLCKTEVYSYTYHETTQALLKMEDSAQKFYNKCIEQFASTITYMAGVKSSHSICSQFKTPNDLANPDETSIDKSKLLDFLLAVGDCQIKVNECFTHVFSAIGYNKETKAKESQDTLASFMGIKTDSVGTKDIEL